MPEPEAQLAALMAEVLASPKYRLVSPELVMAIGRRVLQAHPKLREAVKECKNKLHQIGTAYLEGRLDYAAWLTALQQAGPTERKTICLEAMQRHASTRERLPMLERFYAELFAQLPPISSVLDLACGLNPLARPWMPLSAHATYHACDIFADLVEFVDAALPLLGGPGHAWVHDLSSSVPSQTVDLVLAFKILPVLEQIKRGSARQLLEGLQAESILVSYPLQSLGGRQKGMQQQYERQFAILVEGLPWQITKVHFPTELVFVMRRV